MVKGEKDNVFPAQRYTPRYLYSSTKSRGSLFRNKEVRVVSAGNLPMIITFDFFTSQDNILCNMQHRYLEVVVAHNVRVKAGLSRLQKTKQTSNN